MRNKNFQGVYAIPKLYLNKPDHVYNMVAQIKHVFGNEKRNKLLN